jgi:hypothetical protein
VREAARGRVPHTPFSHLPLRRSGRWSPTRTTERRFPYDTCCARGRRLSWLTTEHGRPHCRPPAPHPAWSQRDPLRGWLEREWPPGRHPGGERAEGPPPDTRTTPRRWQKAASRVPGAAGMRGTPGHGWAPSALGLRPGEAPRVGLPPAQQTVSTSANEKAPRIPSKVFISRV